MPMKSDPKKFSPDPSSGKGMDDNPTLGGVATPSKTWNQKNTTMQYSNGGALPKGELGAGKNG